MLFFILPLQNLLIVSLNHLFLCLQKKEYEELKAKSEEVLEKMKEKVYVTFKRNYFRDLYMTDGHADVLERDTNMATVYIVYRIYYRMLIWSTHVTLVFVIFRENQVKI